MNYESAYGGNLWYLHDVGYEKFFNRSFDIWFYLALLLLFCGIFTVEYKSNNKSGSFYAIMQSTKNGRKKSFISRYLAGLLYLPLWIFFVGGEYFFFIKEWGFPDLSAPLASLHAFENLDAGITVGGYLLLCALLRLLGGALLVLTVSAFSQFTKKPIPTITASLLATLAPHALVLLGVKVLEIIDFTSLIDIHSLVRLSISGQSGTGDGMKSLILFTFVTALLVAVMTAGAYLSFAKIQIFKRGSERT